MDESLDSQSLNILVFLQLLLWLMLIIDNKLECFIILKNKQNL